MYQRYHHARITGSGSSTTRYEEVATGNDHINIDTLKAGEDTISKTLAKLYTKCLSERRIPTAWKNAKMVINFQVGKWERPQELQTNQSTIKHL